MRVHMKPIHHTKVQLDDTLRPSLQSLRLSSKRHILLRLGRRSIQTPHLSHQRPRTQNQPRQHDTKPHHCPPAATCLAGVPAELPEAIVFLIFASISSFVPSPAVTSTTTPFLST